VKDNATTNDEYNMNSDADYYAHDGNVHTSDDNDWQETSNMTFGKDQAVPYDRAASGEDNEVIAEATLTRASVSKPSPHNANIHHAQSDDDDIVIIESVTASTLATNEKSQLEPKSKGQIEIQ
jgi:hypothetical protein